jgi:hypothetical protein
MNSIVKSSIASGIFALAAVVMCPSSAPAQTPTPATHPERAKPAPQPAPQSEADRAKQDEKAKQEARIKREREEALAKERAEKERAEKAKTGTTPPPKQVPVTGVKVAPALTDEQREIMKKAAHFEHVHRVRTARMNRLIRIYKEKGDTAKVQKLEEMKAKEAKRTENAMAGYRKALGEEHWGRLNAEMKRQHGRGEHEKDKEKDKAPSKTGAAR